MGEKLVMENCRGNGLAVHLVQAHLAIAHGKSTAAKIMFSNVVMVHAVMPSPKDGIAARDDKNGRSAPRISQRCVTIKSAVAIIVAATLVAAISLDMVAGRAAGKLLGFHSSFLGHVAMSSTAWSAFDTCPTLWGARRA